MTIEPPKIISEDRDVIESAWDNRWNGRESPAYESGKNLEIPEKPDDIIIELDEDNYIRK